MAETNDSGVLQETRLSWLALFAASGTLICCALPIILVSFGLGATVAALTSSIPLLITIAQYKSWVFAGSATLLLLSGWLLNRSGRACPTDSELAQRCARAQVWNRRIIGVALGLWGIGFFAAYLALPLRIWMESR